MILKLTTFLFLSINTVYSNDVDQYIFSDISADESACSQLINKLTKEAVENVLVSPIKTFILKVQDKNGTWIAGLCGYEFYGSLIIDVLWVDKKFRGKKIGSTLLNLAEKHSLQKGIKIMTVSTMEWWDNLQFYKKNGFVIEFIREGYENNYKQFNLKKLISDVKNKK